MFSRLRRSRLLLLALGAGIAGALFPDTGSAQTIPELRQRVAELESAHAAANALADSLEKRVAGDIQIDTMAIGFAPLIVEGPDMGFIREAVAEAQEMLAADLGQDEDLLEGVALLLTLSGNGRATVGPVTRARSTGGRLVNDQHALAQLLVEGAYQALDIGQSRVIRAWLSARPPTARTEYTHQRSAYRDLAASPFVSARACLGGDIGECRRALGLLETSDGLMTWYDPADRVQMALRLSPPSPRFYPLRRGLYDGCVERGEDASCRNFLMGTPIEPPLPPSLRETLVLEALRTGGPGAYGRMLRASGPVEARLSAAAGVSGDSLISTWRGALVDAAGQPTSTTLPIGLTAVFWMLTFAALGLRSTRWR